MPEYLKRVKNIAVIGSRHQDRYLSGVSKFISALCSRFGELLIEESFGRYLAGSGVALSGSCRFFDALPPDTDLLISLGGDGTFLRAAGRVGDGAIPILGVNTGHLGFLSNCSISESDELVRQLGEDSLRLEHRTLLCLEGEEIPSGMRRCALNEIAIGKEESSAMINIHTRVDGDFLADYLGDGLVVSTPTGSTAYNLSLGGPILQPTLRCMVLTPIAPHTLTLRPLVIDSESIVECTTTSRSENYRVSIDGRSFVMHCGTTLTIRRAPYTIVTLRRPDDNFASTLRNKLLWGSR